jgi:uncharacterized membrane protein YwaF
MPRSLLLSATLFIVFGIACLLWKVFLGFSMPAPLWIILSALAAGIGLLRGYRSARGLASVVIIFGYVAAMFDLISSALPPKLGTTEIWEVYGRVLLGVAILTMVSGFLWSRPVSSYLNRFSDATKQKKT